MPLFRNPLISLIIPTYNRAHLITETIESVKKQTYTNWELIIVDDGSTDNTEEVIKSYISSDPRIFFYRRPSNRAKGANACRNFGFEKAKGEYIKWVDSDDLLDEKSIANQLSIYENTEREIDVVVSNGVYFTDKGITNKLWSKNLISENLLYDHIRNTVRWAVCAALWRKDFFNSAPFKEDLANCQEWLMHSIAILKDPVIEVEPNVLFKIRASERGRLSNNTSAEYYYNQARSKYLLLFEYCKTRNISLKIIFELLKQMGVFSFHVVRQTCKLNFKSKV
jgi:glycosyltransferase involved in cell wall biosynthesis